MENIKVKDLMIPIDEYSIVDQDDTLIDVIHSMEIPPEQINLNRHPHRAVLVVDEDNNIIGKIGHHGFLMALEPKYNNIDNLDEVTSLGVSSEYLKSIMEDLSLWEDKITNICKRAGNIIVKDVMHPVKKNIEEDASIFIAIHKLIMWQCLSLLVTRKSRIVGIIRLSDIYEKIAKYIKNECSQS